MFFKRDVSSLESLSTFFLCFDFEKKEFDVYIGFEKDPFPIKTLFEKITFSGRKILVLHPNEVRPGIKTRHQKTILKFEAIKEYDMYSAYKKAYEINVADQFDWRTAIESLGHIYYGEKPINNTY